MSLNDELGLKPAIAKQKKVAPTRLPELNGILPGGYAYGKINLVFGEPSTGKTTHLIEAVADEMEKDKKMRFVLIPSERGEDMEYYENLGLDLSRTSIVEEDQYIMENVIAKIESILEVAEKHNIKAIMVDSWDGLIPNAAMYDTHGVRKSSTKMTVGAAAKVASEKLKHIKGLIGTKDILFLVVAQVRTGGIGGYTVFKTFSGGKALEHNADIVVFTDMAGFIRKKIDGHDVTVGHNVRYTLKKTKLNRNAHKFIEMPYHYEEGWDQFTGVWVEAQVIGALEKLGGGWYECSLFPEAGAKNLRRMRGEDNAKGWFKEDNSRIENLKDLISETAKNNAIAPPTTTTDDDEALHEFEE